MTRQPVRYTKNFETWFLGSFLVDCPREKKGKIVGYDIKVIDACGTIIIVPEYKVKWTDKGKYGKETTFNTSLQ